MRTSTVVLICLMSAIPFLLTDQAWSDTRFPHCESERVLKKVVRRFNLTEKIYWRSRGLVMTGIERAHLHSENPFPESPINRRYCHADAFFEDGLKRRVHFLIEQGAGFAGFSWNVEYCVHGLDPWKYYDGRCRVLSR